MPNLFAKVSLGVSISKGINCIDLFEVNVIETYSKTDAGKQEIQDRSRKLPAPLRLLLLMVDGQRDRKRLRELITGLNAPGDGLEQLLDMGLIERNEPVDSVSSAAIPLGATAAAPLLDEVKLPADAGAYRQLYEILTEVVRAHLGLKGYFIQLKVEKCTDVEALVALLPEVATALTKAKDHTFASEWLARTRVQIQP